MSRVAMGERALLSCRDSEQNDLAVCFASFWRGNRWVCLNLDTFLFRGDSWARATAVGASTSGGIVDMISLYREKRIDGDPDERVPISEWIPSFAENSKTVIVACLDKVVRCQICFSSRIVSVQELPDEIRFVQESVGIEHLKISVLRIAKSLSQEWLYEGLCPLCSRDLKNRDFGRLWRCAENFNSPHATYFKSQFIRQTQLAADTPKSRNEPDGFFAIANAASQLAAVSKTKRKP